MSDPSTPPPRVPHEQAYGPPYGPPYGQVPRTNGKAIAALVVGVTSLVLSVCCLGLAGVVAVVIGFKARAQIAGSRGQQTGDGLALAGIITGALATLLSLALITLLVIALANGGAEFTPDNHVQT